MNYAARAAAVIAVWLGAAAAIYTTCVLPCRCNEIEMRIESLTLRAADAAEGSLYASRIAHDNLARLQMCLHRSPTVNSLMIAAANQRILGRYSEAVALYEKAMQYDRRPELYLNLGLAQIASGEARIGVENIVTACIYNPWMIDDVSLGHDEVERRISLYKMRIEELKKAKR